MGGGGQLTNCSGWLTHRVQCCHSADMLEKFFFFCDRVVTTAVFGGKNFLLVFVIIRVLVPQLIVCIDLQAVINSVF